MKAPTTTTETKKIPTPRAVMKTEETTTTTTVKTTTPVTAAKDETELKQLGFVRDAACVGADFVKARASFAIGAYETARDATALKGSLNKIEALLTHYGAPVAKKVVDAAPGALATADSTVDSAVKALGNAYEARVKNSYPMKTANAAYAYAMNAKDKYPENIEALKAARAEYLAKIETAVEELKVRAVKVPEEAYAALKTAIAQARQALDSDKLFARVKTLWEQVISNPRVVAVVERATPVAERVLAQPIVNKAIGIATPYAVAIGKRIAPKAVAA